MFSQTDSGEGGLKKNDMWDPMYEDSMNLLAKLPPIAAYIYRMKYKADIHIQADPKLDWGGNFAHMMGVAPPYDELARMYSSEIARYQAIAKSINFEPQ